MYELQAEQDSAVSDVTPHIVNIGRMVEDMENKIRNTLNDIYFGNTSHKQPLLIAL